MRMLVKRFKRFIIRRELEVIRDFCRTKPEDIYSIHKLASMDPVERAKVQGFCLGLKTVYNVIEEELRG